MKTLLIFTCIFSFFSLSWGDSTKIDSSSSSIDNKTKTENLSAITITLSEMVDPGMASYTKRAISDAKSKKPDIIIFEVNTFGGRLDAAFEIVDAITEIRDIRTIALVNKKAISAGALISLAADEMYMRPNTTIGDCAPIIQGQDGPTMLGEKIQSPLRAKFRGLAQKNGYSELLSMAMVSENLEIFKLTAKADSSVIEFMQSVHYDELSEKEKSTWHQKTTIVQAGELLTITNSEAVEFGFSKGTMEDIESLKTHLNVTEVKEIKISWSESMVRALAALSPILLLLGFGSLYIEIKTPGFGFFGVLGILCIGIVFGGQYLTGLSDHLAIVLFALGALLIIVEMFVFPGTWISGAIGLLCFIAALSIGMTKQAQAKEDALEQAQKQERLKTSQEAQDKAKQSDKPPADQLKPGQPNDEPDTNKVSDSISEKTSPTLTPAKITTPKTSFETYSDQVKYLLLLALGGLIFPIVFARYILPNIPARHGVMLNETLEDAHVQDGAFGFRIGQEGKAINLLKPMGTVDFDGKLKEVTARSGFIDQDCKVRICSVENHQIWVEEIPQVQAEES